MFLIQCAELDRSSNKLRSSINSYLTRHLISCTYRIQAPIHLFETLNLWVEKQNHPTIVKKKLEWKTDILVVYYECIIHNLDFVPTLYHSLAHCAHCTVYTDLVNWNRQQDTQLEEPVLCSTCSLCFSAHRSSMIELCLRNANF